MRDREKARKAAAVFAFQESLGHIFLSLSLRSRTVDTQNITCACEQALPQ
jgi:hypothetical protein